MGVASCFMSTVALALRYGAGASNIVGPTDKAANEDRVVYLMRGSFLSVFHGDFPQVFIRVLLWTMDIF